MHQQRSGASRPALTRWLAVDPLGPLLAVVGVGVFLLRGFDGVLTRDLALYAYGGQQFAEGVPPYESVLNRAGPLAHMVPGVGAMIARAVGADDLLTMRVLMMALSALAVWLTYVLGRDALASRLAGVVAATTLLSFQGFVVYATGGPREKTTMLLLVVCALLAVVHRRWGLAGAAVALATLTWQPAFVVGTTAAVVAALFLPWRRVPAAAGRFVVGGLVPTALVTGYFWGAGALQEFLDGFYFINARFTDQTGLREFLELEPGAMAEGFGWSRWLLVAGLVALPLVGLAALRGPVREEARRPALLGMGVAVGASLLWSLRAFNGWADAIFVLPLAAVGVAGVAAPLARRLGSRAGVALVTAYAVVVLVASGATAWLDRPTELPAMRAEVAAALEVTGPGTSVLSVGAPQPLVLGRLRNPIRHQMFLTGLNQYLDEELPGGLAGLAAEVEADRPTFITMDHPTWYDWIRPVVREHYEYVGTTYEVVWYVDTAVGEERVERVRQVLGSGP